jgi:hypothetical protein
MSRFRRSLLLHLFLPLSFHFIGYMPSNGRRYELDGLTPGPILLHTDGPVTPDNWMAHARAAIQARLAHYASKEIRFNLMALIGNQVRRRQQCAHLCRGTELTNLPLDCFSSLISQAEQIKSKIAKVQAQLAAAQPAAAAAAPADGSAPMDTGAAAPAAASGVSAAAVPFLQEELQHLEKQLADETHKMDRWRVRCETQQWKLLLS